MLPVKFNHHIPCNHVHSLFDSLLEDDFFGPLPQNRSFRKGLFAADIFEKDSAYVIKADMPGVDKKDVTIDLSEGTLTITAQKVEDKEIRQENIFKKERFSGTYKRSFTLSEHVDQDRIKAFMKDGVLEVTLPHSEKKEVRQITIN